MSTGVVRATAGPDNSTGGRGGGWGPPAPTSGGRGGREGGELKTGNNTTVYTRTHCRLRRALAPERLSGCGQAMVVRAAQTEWAAEGNQRSVNALEGRGWRSKVTHGAGEGRGPGLLDQEVDLLQLLP